MLAGHQIKNHLQKTGGTMTGDLMLSAGKLVDGRDISAMVRAKLEVGTYTGNGADNRNIDIGFDPMTKTNVFLFIKGVAPGVGKPGIMRDEHGQGDMSFPFDANTNTANKIQSFYNSGFQLGNDATVNANGELYLYTMMWEEP